MLRQKLTLEMLKNVKKKKQKHNNNNNNKLNKVTSLIPQMNKWSSNTAPEGFGSQLCIGFHYALLMFYRIKLLTPIKDLPKAQKVSVMSVSHSCMENYPQSKKRTDLTKNI